MAPKIQHKRSAVAGKRPNPLTDLAYGEIAIGYHHASPVIYARGDDNSLLEWHAWMNIDGGFANSLYGGALPVIDGGTAA